MLFIYNYLRYSSHPERSRSRFLRPAQSKDLRLFFARLLIPAAASPALLALFPAAAASLLLASTNLPPHAPAPWLERLRSPIGAPRRLNLSQASQYPLSSAHALQPRLWCAHRSQQHRSWALSA